MKRRLGRYSEAAAEYLATLQQNEKEGWPIPYGFVRSLSVKHHVNSYYLLRYIRRLNGSTLTRRGSPIDYANHNFCPKCRLLYPKTAIRCAYCGNVLRSKPRIKNRHRA